MPDSELSAGSVVALFIVECREAPMKKVEQLNALAGQGFRRGPVFSGHWNLLEKA